MSAGAVPRSRHDGWRASSAVKNASSPPGAPNSRLSRGTRCSARRLRFRHGCLPPQHFGTLDDFATFGQCFRFPIRLEDLDPAAAQEGLIVGPELSLAMIEVGRQVVLDGGEHPILFVVGTRLFPSGCAQTLITAGRVADHLMPRFPLFGFDCAQMRLGRFDDGAAVRKRRRLPVGAENFQPRALQNILADRVRPDLLFLLTEGLVQVRLDAGERLDLALAGLALEAGSEQARVAVAGRSVQIHPAALDVPVEGVELSSSVVDGFIDVRRLRRPRFAPRRFDGIESLGVETPFVLRQCVDPTPAALGSLAQLLLRTVKRLLDILGRSRRPERGQFPEEQIEALLGAEAVKAVHLLLGPHQSPFSENRIRRPAVLLPHPLQVRPACLHTDPLRRHRPNRLRIAAPTAPPRGHHALPRRAAALS